MAGGGRRIACLYVPDLPLAALLRSEPDLVGEAVAVVVGEGARQRIGACSPAARRGGVVPGMGVNGARGVLPGLVLRPACAARVRSARAALVDVARSFSPRVAREPGGEICLDVGGQRHLHAGERTLGAALLSQAGKAGLDARAGIAATRFCARMAARTCGGFCVVAAGEERAFLAPLPVRLLEASADLHAALGRFGIERLGQLAALEGRGLGRRLGPAGLRLWRLARGVEHEPLVAEPVPERFVEECDCPHPVDRVEPLLFVLRGVFERLAGRLALRGLAARELRLSCDLEPAGSDERTLELAAPCAGAHTWLEVARVGLEAASPRAPVVSVRAEATVTPARRTQLNLFSPAACLPAALDDIQARLAALSGAGRVGSPRPVDTHRPGAFALVPFGTRTAAITPLPAGLQAASALRVLRPPEEVDVRLQGDRPRRVRGKRIHGRVLACAGPWRLDAEWWCDDPLARDYYEVELTDGGVYRLFCDRHSRQWFIDGVCG